MRNEKKKTYLWPKRRLNRRLGRFVTAAGFPLIPTVASS
jgi:hypothetical protein